MNKKAAILDFEEGYSSKPYYCSEGYPTVAIGKKIGPKNAPLEYYQFTVSEELARYWLNADILDLEMTLARHHWYVKLDDNRQAIILSMAYQMGYRGLMGFKRMIAALEKGDFAQAKGEALDSKWAKRDTPLRANRHAEVLETGILQEIYG